MKTLQQFWYYFEAEQPDVSTAINMAVKNLSSEAMSALEKASVLIRERATGQGGAPNYSVRLVLESHPSALRDLSMNLMPALEAMHEVVPAYVSEPFVLDFTLPRGAVWASLPPTNHGVFSIEYTGTFVYEDKGSSDE